MGTSPIIIIMPPDYCDSLPQCGSASGEGHGPCAANVERYYCTVPDFLDSFFEYHHAAASRASSL
jgi:hypothetical protein